MYIVQYYKYSSSYEEPLKTPGDVPSNVPLLPPGYQRFFRDTSVEKHDNANILVRNPGMYPDHPLTITGGPGFCHRDSGPHCLEWAFDCSI